jgi:hypothetical protein
VTTDEVHQRILLEAGADQAYYLLSFVDDAGTFLGATCVRAGGLASALHRTHVLRINPGGAVRSTRLDAAPLGLIDHLETSSDRARDLMAAHTAIVSPAS